MLELPHALVGAAIATAIPNPIISLPLSLASHFLTEYIPHWNPHLYTEVTTSGRVSRSSFFIILTDSSLALLSGSWIALGVWPDVGRTATILAACFLAVLPDVIEIPFFFLGLKPKWIEKIVYFQRGHQWNVQPIWGILFQLLVVTLSLILIFSRP